VPTTVGRSRGRQGVHAGAQGAAGDHTRKITATLLAATVVIVAVLVLTKVGRDIDAATQHFMLYYAGVLTLVGLTGSVLLGLVATDRIVMTPGHRVMAQAVHRAFSFGTLAFLVIHIVTEILAQRSHVIDSVVPFLSPYRTFYIGLGTIASDLIVLLVVTSILRKRFTAHGKAWRWRAIHYTAYVAFVFGVLHGLLGGRTAKPYVDWSYGFAIAVTALGLAVRFLAISLRPKESLLSSPSADRARPAGSSPLHTAAMRMAQAQLGSTMGTTVQVLPPALGGPGLGGPRLGGPGLGGQGGAGPDTWAALPAPGRSPASGPFPALAPAPAYAGPPPDLGVIPLGAPPYGDDVANGMRGRLYVTADSHPAMAGPVRQPRYEPGYDGPPRFEGAPRGHGDIPQDELSSYLYGPPGRRAQPASPYPQDYPDRAGAGGWAGSQPGWPGGIGGAEPTRPRAAIPAPPRPGDQSSGPMPRLGTGPMPRFGTGPMPQPGTGPMSRADSGPMPRLGTGPMPRQDTARPRPDGGPLSRGGQGLRDSTGPLPRNGTGPLPRTGTGPLPRTGTGPLPRTGTGPLPRADSGPPPGLGSGPMPRFGTGSGTGSPPRPDTGPLPRVGQGPPVRNGTGPLPRAGAGPLPRADSGPPPGLGSGPMPRLGTGPLSRLYGGPPPRLDAGPVPRPDTGASSRPGARRTPRHGRPGPADDAAAGSPPRPAPRPPRRAKSTDPRYPDGPGPTVKGAGEVGGEWQ
jgi:DMSO/TMAO reductase YedYZ heme-binding membrane subunit